MSITDDGIHIISGLSAAGSFKHAYHMTDRLLVNQDILSCGPTPYNKNLDEWEKVRLSYLRSIYTDWPDIDFKGHDMDLLSNIERIKNYDLVYIWVGSGLEDQLLVLFFIFLNSLVDGSREIRLIRFEKLQDSKYSIRSMGELSPERMLVHPKPTLITEKDTAVYLKAWESLTSNKATSLYDFIKNCSDNNIVYILNLMLRRYPDRGTGLVYWDFKILEKIQNHGPSAARVIGYTIGDQSDDGDYVGDSYVFKRMRDMADECLAKPLVVLSGEQTTFRDTEVCLSKFGEAVLSGQESSYPTNIIDEWVGGVNISSINDNLWFFKDGKVVSANET